MVRGPTHTTRVVSLEEESGNDLTDQCLITLPHTLTNPPCWTRRAALAGSGSQTQRTGDTRQDIHP